MEFFQAAGLKKKENGAVKVMRWDSSSGSVYTLRPLREYRDYLRSWIRTWITRSCVIRWSSHGYISMKSDSRVTGGDSSAEAWEEIEIQNKEE